MMMKPLLALTMGDPAGIGPELVVRAVADSNLGTIADLRLYGAPEVLHEAARRFLGKPELPASIRATSSLPFDRIPVGKADPACGLAARDAVIAAVRDALDGNVSAIVTAPMNKASVNLAGIPFTGHTELIAELCGINDYAMMQSADDLRVAFVTTHIPLCDVSRHVTAERIEAVAHLLADAIREEGIDAPRIAVAAINPHAGENGYMGREDEAIVKPAVERLRSAGMNIDGPFPPDTLFIESIRRNYDGILSMYHDQGHIPFKMLAFDRGVNSTLGLPIIRTSVDHGTAFPIAWRGVADPGSLHAAIRLAAIRARKRGE
jgi:4-hydroxythreonine-4-phosphate dehydrogenase